MSISVRESVIKISCPIRLSFCAILFFVFDQIGNWIPDYPYQLSDTLIDGKLFARRYDKALDGAFYERRWVIVENMEHYLFDNLDINKKLTYINSNVNRFFKFVDLKTYNFLIHQ